MLPRGPLGRRQLGNLRVYPQPSIRTRRNSRKSSTSPR